MESTTEKVLRYGSLVTTFLIPWISFGRWVFPHTTSKVFLFYGFISILTALWVYLLITDTRYRFTKRELFMIAPLLLYTLWMTIAGITAKNTGLAFWGTLMRGTGLLTLYTTTCYAFIIASLAKRYDKGYIITFLKWFLGGSAIVVLSVWLGDEGFNTAINVLRKGSGGGVTGNSTLAGAYLLFVLGLTAFLIVSNRIGKKVWLWILGIAILCSPLFINLYGLLTGKGILGSARGAFLGIIVTAAVSMFVYFTFSSKKVFKILGIGGLVAGIVIGVIGWGMLLTPGTKLHEKFIGTASGTRFAFWHISQEAMNERSLVGYGPENFSIAQARYFDPQFLSKDLAFEAWTDHPHNVYYDNGVAAGYPGIVLYILFIGSLIYIVYRNQYLVRAQKSILIGILVGYIVQNLVGLDGFITLFALATFVAVVYGSNTSSPSSSLKAKRYPILLWTLLGISLIGVYFLGYQPAHKAKLFGSVLGSKLNVRSARYQEFLSGSPVGNYWDVSGFAYDEYKLYAKDPLAVKQNQTVLPYAIKDIDSYITYLEALTKKNKTDYRLYFSLVNLYNTKIYFSDLKYDQDLATHMTALINYAQTLAPTDPRIYWLYAQLAAWKGDLPGVVAAYNKGIAIDPTLPISHKLLIRFLEGTGNQILFKEAVAAAQKEIPNFSLN